MQRVRRRIWVGALLAIAVLVFVALQYRIEGGPQRLEDATRVLDAASWIYSGKPTYDWLSDHELLYYSKELRGGTNFHVPVCIDLRSGKESRLGVAQIFSSY